MHLLAQAVEPIPVPRVDWRAIAPELALAGAGVVLLLVVAFSPGARSAFLEIFHLKGATVERVEELPEVEVQAIDFGEQAG